MENVRDRYVVAGHDDLVSFCGFLSPSVSDIVAVGNVLFCLFSLILVLLHVPLFPPSCGLLLFQPFSGWRQV